MPRIHLVSNLPGAGALGDHLRRAGLGPTSARAADALVVLIDRPLDQSEQDVLDRARQSVPVLLAGPTMPALPVDSPLFEATGLVPARPTPVHELRLGAGPHGPEVAARLGAETAFVDSWLILDKIADDVQQLVMVRHELSEQPVCTWRPSTGLGVLTLGVSPATLADPAFQRLVGRWLRHAMGVPDEPPVQVGVLGTTGSAGRHAVAVADTPGLELAAVMDPPAGHPVARPDGDRRIRHVTTPLELINDSELGLLVVATRANTRAEWAMRALEAGKHVVIDQPFSLSTHDADELATVASARDLTIATHLDGGTGGMGGDGGMDGDGGMGGDGRSDPAYRALAAAVRAGAIGPVLAVEAFAGSRRHPDGGWHDDARLSGGQLFDRGAAPVERILDLVGRPVEWVSATACKRVWHDVTNADHTQVLIRFEGGAEGRLVLSDLTTVPRPAITVLGTAGEIVGPQYGARYGLRDSATTGSGAVTLHAADGSITRLGLPPALDAPFHRALADHLVSGWPLPVGWPEARHAVAVLEAAARSVATDGALTVPG